MAHEVGNEVATERTALTNTGQRFYWHVGAAAALGFACGTLAVAAAVILQAWVENWVFSLLGSLLLLLLSPLLALRLLALLAETGNADEPKLLASVGHLWMRLVPSVFPTATGAAEQSDGERAATAVDAKFPNPPPRLSHRVVREVMVPRPDVIGVPADASISRAATIMLEHGVSRAPVFEWDLDGTEGVVHVKDLLAALMRGEGDRPVKEIARPAQFVPETKPLSELLQEMQQGGFHLAVVSDEYGSVSGVVSLEDLIEELVGQIADEFDHEAPEIVPLPDGSYRVQASLPIVDLNELLGVELPHASWNTVGGLVFGLAGRIPEVGTSVELEGVRFVVERVQGRRIVTVLVYPPQRAAGTSSTSRTAS
ncbi:MAG: hemolysin family protein [Candidatus Binatia bacterium]|nr:hemolysin family protein [Candidatus Binatia bacterium]